MAKLELQQHLLSKYTQKNAHCEWKVFKNLKNLYSKEQTCRMIVCIKMEN